MSLKISIRNFLYHVTGPEFYSSRFQTLYILNILGYIENYHNQRSIIIIQFI